MTSEPAGMKCLSLHFSRHALERMFQRGIPPDALSALLDKGEIIASYADDQPYPSVLMLGWFESKPVHAVIAKDPLSAACQVITVYRPDPMLWDAAFKSRKKS
jgi:hypothetical protein